MDWANVIFGILLTTYGWLLKSLWDAVGALRKDLSLLEVKIPEAYVRKDELREFMADTKSSLIRIESKLDNKADK